jgi:hypothetical protein
MKNKKQDVGMKKRRKVFDIPLFFHVNVLFFIFRFVFLPEILIQNSMADAGSALSGAASGAATGAAFGPWGAAIGGVIGLGGALLGSSKASKEQKRIEALLNQQQTDNQAWYNANALGDYTQRADAQNMLRNLRENLARQNKAAANTAVVTGATPEQQAVQQEQSNKVIADTYANIGAMGQQYKDRITEQYLARKSALESSQLGMMNDSLSNYSTLFNNSIGQIGNAAMAFGSYLDNKGKTGTVPQTP